MDKNEKAMNESSCKSVFRSGDNTMTKERFTRVWIALINSIEKGKRNSRPGT